MGTLAALTLQLAITAMQHATELSQLLATASAEGRDVTPAELDALKTKASDSLDALQAAIDTAKAAKPV